MSEQELKATFMRVALLQLNSQKILKKSISELDGLLENNGRWLFYKYKRIVIDNNVEYLPTEVNHAVLAAFLRKKYYLITLQDAEVNGQIMRYSYDLNLYLSDGKRFIREWVADLWIDEALDDVSCKHVAQFIEDNHHIERTKFTLPEQYVAVNNGILEFYKEDDTWKVLIFDHTPRLFITNKLDVDWNPDTEDDQFSTYLETSFYENDIEYMQEWYGNMLTRDVRYPGSIMVLVGPPTRGKSTLQEMSVSFLGSRNCVAVKLQDLCENNKYEKVRLYNKMFCYYDDISPDDVKRSGEIKNIARGGMTSARTLYQPSFDFESFAFLQYNGNMLPRINEDGDLEAIYKSLRVVVVDKYTPNDNTSDDFKKRLRESKDVQKAMLRWAIEGRLQYLNNGHKYSNYPTWEETMRKWNEWGNPLARFMESDSVVYGSECVIGKNVLYLGYKFWHEQWNENQPQHLRRPILRYNTFWKEFKNNYLDSRNYDISQERFGNNPRVIMGLDLSNELQGILLERGIIHDPSIYDYM